VNKKSSLQCRVEKRKAFSRNVLRGRWLPQGTPAVLHNGTESFLLSQYGQNLQSLSKNDKNLDQCRMYLINSFFVIWSK
jgi:hypothetical protein